MSAGQRVGGLLSCPQCPAGQRVGGLLSCPQCPGALQLFPVALESLSEDEATPLGLSDLIKPPAVGQSSEIAENPRSLRSSCGEVRTPDARLFHCLPGSDQKLARTVSPTVADVPVVSSARVLLEASRKLYCWARRAPAASRTIQPGVTVYSTPARTAAER